MLLAELLTQRRLKVVRTCPLQCSKSLHTLMMTRRTLLGALKCAFRDLRRELATIDWTLVIFAVGWAGCRVSRQSSCRTSKIRVVRMCRSQTSFASLASAKQFFRCAAATPVRASWQRVRRRLAVLGAASPATRRSLSAPRSSAFIARQDRHIVWSIYTIRYLHSSDACDICRHKGFLETLVWLESDPQLLGQ